MLATLLEWIAPHDITRVTRAAGAHVGLDVIGVFVTDMEQHMLQPLEDVPSTGPYEIDATMAGRAYRTMEPAEAEGTNGARRLFLPLLDSSERLGVLEAQVAEADDRARRHGELLAGALAKVITAVKEAGDLLQRTRRTRPMRLASEIQWELLPPLTLSTAELTIAGILEPCYEIGGDAFDYAVNSGTAHLMLVDAMGHGLDSSLIASLVIGSYRHSRRAGDPLAETYAAMDEVVADRFGPDRFATAQLVELDARSGALRWINAGHPPGMLVRDGKMVGSLEHPPALPIGYGQPGDAGFAEITLQPGDAVLWFTDGVIEARSPRGEYFEEPRLADLFTRALGSGTTVPEVMRRLNQAVLEHQGSALHDDATMLCLVWHGHP